MSRQALLSILIALAAGFFVGRATVKKTETIRYVQGETVSGTVYTGSFTVGKELKEFKTDIADLPLIFWKRDTVILENEVFLKQEIDTLKILNDFLIKREYAFNVFDDENGKMDVNQTIQYNKLQSFDYTFTPMQKEITRTKERLFVPFVSASYNTLNYVGAGGGVFIKDLGLEYNYLFNTFDKRTAHSFGVKYKF